MRLIVNFSRVQNERWSRLRRFLSDPLISCARNRTGTSVILRLKGQVYCAGSPAKHQRFTRTLLAGEDNIGGLLTGSCNGFWSIDLIAVKLRDGTTGGLPLSAFFQ